MKQSDRFQEIADEAVRAAEEVECGLEEFAEGLDTIRIWVSDRLNMVRDEIRHRDKE